MSRFREKQNIKRAARALEGGHIDVYGALRGGHIDVYGADKWSQAGGALSALSEAGKGIGDLVTAQQSAHDAADKQNKIDKARQAMVDAKSMLAKADLVEHNADGPAHKEAQRAIIDAQAALDKLTGGDSSSADSGGKGKGKPAGGFSMPSYGWYAIGGLGALVVGVLGYKMLKGKKRR